MGERWRDQERGAGACEGVSERSLGQRERKEVTGSPAIEAKSPSREAGTEDTRPVWRLQAAGRSQAGHRQVTGRSSTGYHLGAGPMGVKASPGAASP